MDKRSKAELKKETELLGYVRELEKADNTLEQTERYLKAHAEMNASLHCANEILFSPLYGQVVNARQGIKTVLRTWKRKIPKQQIKIGG